jgi:hypothetical protein
MAENVPVQHQMKGGLSLDIDPGSVTNQKYTAALNAQFISRLGEETMPISPVIGNQLAFDMGSVPAQNKVYLLGMQPNTTYVMRTLKTDQINQFVSDITINQPTLALIASFIEGIFLSFGKQVDVTVQDGQIRFELLSPAGYDYYIQSVQITGVSVFSTLIIQEAIPQNYAGVLYGIGSNDLNTNLFVFSTPQTNLPEEFDILSVFNSGGQIAIQISSVLPFVSGDEVFVSGLPATSGANGYWIVQTIGVDSFVLLESTFSSPFTGQGSVVINSRGVGEIGVATYDINTDAWTYTRLLRSIELGFTTQRQIECRGEIKAIGRALYFHQVKYNPPRVFYYRGDFIQDGALRFVSPVNRYDYGNIADEIRNQANYLTGCLEFLRQDVGGSLTGGNKQYFIRMVGERGSLFTTDAHAFTGLVATPFQLVTLDPASISGGSSAENSGKRNFLRAFNLRNDIYNFIELGVLEWFGDSVTASIVRREEISGPEIILEHNGGETLTPIALAEVFATQPVIENIGSEVITDNRLVYLDIDYRQDDDFRDWAQTITHRIFKEAIQSTTGSYNDFLEGGFLTAANTVKYMGYTWNETHRFGLRLYLKDGGGVTQTYWIDDIKFDISPTNITVPNRRTGNSTAPNYDLNGLNNGLGASVTFVPCVEFDLDLSYLIDGVPIRSLVEKIEFMRVDLNDSPSLREILFSGYAVQGDDGFSSSGSNRFGYPNPTETLPSGQQLKIYGPAKFFSGRGLFPNPNSVGGYNTAAASSGSAASIPNGTSTATLGNDTYFAFILSPDICIGGRSAAEFVPGDKLINYGRPLASFSNDINDNLYRDFELLGLGVSVGGLTPVPPSEFVHNIEDTAVLPRSSSVSLRTPPASSVTLPFVTMRSFAFSSAVSSLSGVVVPTFEFEACQAITLSTSFAVPDNTALPFPFATYNNTNEGVYYVAYYRPRAYDPTNPDASKFGNREETTYTTTGNFILVDSGTPLSVTARVFGGDTFVSRMQFKAWNHLDQNPANPTDFQGANQALGMVCQSYVNPLMRSVVDLDPAAMFPPRPFKDYDVWLSNFLLDQMYYDTSYSYHKAIVSPGFGDTEDFEFKFPTLVIWSDNTPDGAFFDGYRNFPPANQKELPRDQGRIVHAEILFDELFILQERAWKRAYFNSTALIDTDTSDQIALGNVGVMNRKETQMSSYGTRNKWSVIRGRMSSGNDCLYWMNTEYGVIVRYGSATGNITVASGIDQFFKENSNWIYENDTPAGGNGVSGVWNERFREARWFVRGYRKPDIEVWAPRTNYFVGQTILGPASGFSTVTMKICIKNNFSSSLNNPFTGVDSDEFWEDVSLSDRRYFNFYSIVYSEAKEAITTFLTPVPMIAMQWGADFLTQKYGAFARKPVFIENKGLPEVWYDSDGSVLSEDGYIEPVINWMPDVTKHFYALYVNSQFAPDRVEFFTPNQESYLLQSDFEARENMWVAPIKNDILTAINGTPDEDTSQLYGRFIKVRLYFNAGKNQFIRDIRVRLKVNSRYLQT